MTEGLKFQPVLPLDQMILDFLPDEGSTFAGIYPIGEQVRAIGQKVTKGQVPNSLISSRMRLMHTAGFVTPVATVGGKASGKAWQVTAAGKKMLAEWKNGASNE